MVDRAPLSERTRTPAGAYVESLGGDWQEVQADLRRQGRDDDREAEEDADYNSRRDN